MSFKTRMKLWYYITGFAFLLFMFSAGVDFWTEMLGLTTFVLILNPVYDAAFIIVRNDRESDDEPL